MKKLVETAAPSVFIPTKKPVMAESTIREGVEVLAVEGIFGKVNARNENNRRYPLSIWEKNLGKGSGFRSRMEARAVLGELEHPESGNTHLERVSHIITDAWVEELDTAKIAEMGLTESEVTPGMYVVGRYEVLNTPRGSILRALHEAGVRVGISSRGRGDIRQVDGIDEVCDDYELDTWDTVYLPSVTEANPRPMRSEANDLGSQLPSAAGSGQADVTPTVGVPEGDWKAEAEEIIRALEKAVSGNVDQISDMIEVFPRGINLIDQLAVIDDQEAVKLKAQALTLIRVLTTQIQELEAGKAPSDVGGEPEKAEPKEAPKEEKPKDKEDEDNKEESVHEGTMKDLAAGVKDNPDYQSKALMKGDVESLLNSAGHEADDVLVSELGNELRAQGFDVDTDKYESIQEATKNEMTNLVDGTIVSVSAKNLLKRFKDTEECCSKHPEVSAFLEKQEGDLLARVCSKGQDGYVVRLLEPAYGESNIFVKYADVKQPVMESKGKKESSMQIKEVLAEAVKENDKLKKQMESMVPQKRYEAAKKVIEDLQTQLETVDKGVSDESVPKKRYEAAKELIAGLVERCKQSDKEKIGESKRVGAATKLIHKLVSEMKGGTKPGSEVKSDDDGAVTYGDKGAKKKAKKEGVDDGVADESAVEDAIESMTEAVQVSAKAHAAIKAEAIKAEIDESADEVVNASAKLTEESKDLKKRLRGKVEDVREPVKESYNLMDAVINKVS